MASMEGMQVSGVQPQPMPLNVNIEVVQAIMVDEDGMQHPKTWVMMTVANPGGISFAWLEPGASRQIANILLDKAKEAEVQQASKLIIPGTAQVVDLNEVRNGDNAPGS